MALKNSTCYIEPLAIQTVRKGRQLQELLASVCDLPIGALQRSALSATLRRLELGEVTDGRDLATFEALRFGAEHCLPAENSGTRCEFQLAGYDEDGEVWGLATLPSYTKRGEKLVEILACLEEFMRHREQLLDRINARRLTAFLLR